MPRPPSRNGDRITGSVKPFQSTQYKLAYQQLTTGIPTFQLAHYFRTIVKQMSADRMRSALVACNLFAPLPQERLVSLLYEYEVPYEVCRYLVCLIDYFNDENLCEFHVLTEKCSKSTRRISAVKRGIRDVEAVIETDVCVVSKKLAGTKCLGNLQQTVVGKYKTIDSATNLFLEMLEKMYLKPLPDKVSDPIFRAVRMLDPTIEKYYHAEGMRFVRDCQNDKYHAARRLNTDAAAVLALFMSLTGD